MFKNALLPKPPVEDGAVADALPKPPVEDGAVVDALPKPPVEDGAVVDALPKPPAEEGAVAVNGFVPKVAGASVADCPKIVGDFPKPVPNAVVVEVPEPKGLFNVFAVTFVSPSFASPVSPSSTISASSSLLSTA